MQLLPWLALIDASLAAARRTLEVMASPSHDRPEPDWDWTTPNTVIRELPTMRLRQFGGGQGPAVILVAPYALHRATIADLAPGHSVIEALLGAGTGRIWLTDWRSADGTRRHQSIDHQLEDLTVAVDDAGSPAAVVGLCQGGTLAAIHAARFPAKTARLVLVGAPIDMAAAPSLLTGLIDRTPPAAVELMLDQGGGLVRGRAMREAWPNAAADEALMAAVLQRRRVTPALAARFRAWNEDVVDLPGAFYRQTVDWLFRENRLARGTFPALGRETGLYAVVCPLVLVAAREDEIVSAPQVLAMARHVATPPDRIATHLVAGRHLSLFMGRDVLDRTWPEIAAFLAAGTPPAARPGKARGKRA
ncbi:alpha/beta fold hydrolase [Phreatobacter cathodiphilus]|uniref:Poly(3-hydroxyalkanoate) synthetase n=1 Tax=Phreatobacter cathodiphilus TaxID=1868589 RepID=A0A2S0N924_9HYPH|nr:alpha/beta fold hydrolase [Phreatobacter cathodiphilus]AVO44441.1 poly(3-hydroxyalkanoate) synthetase [Phreatobacter cathodiphilus]